VGRRKNLVSVLLLEKCGASKGRAKDEIEIIFSGYFEYIVYPLTFRKIK